MENHATVQSQPGETNHSTAPSTVADSHPSKPLLSELGIRTAIAINWASQRSIVITSNAGVI